MDDKEKEQIEREGGIVDESEERIIIKPLWSWSILIALCLWILGWGMFIMMNVRDVDRRWDFGQYEDTPASSVLSSSNENFRHLKPQLDLPGKDFQKGEGSKEKVKGSKQ